MSKHGRIDDAGSSSSGESGGDIPVEARELHELIAGVQAVLSHYSCERCEHDSHLKLKAELRQLIDGQN